MLVSIRSIVKSFFTKETFHRYFRILPRLFRKTVSLGLVMFQNVLCDKLLITSPTVKLEIRLLNVPVEVLGMITVELPLVLVEISLQFEGRVAELTGVILLLCVSLQVVLHAVVLHHLPAHVAGDGEGLAGNVVM